MIGIVLGSGLGPLADVMQVDREVSFSNAGLPASTVPGHSGMFLIGSFADTPVIVMKGRVHLYEGHNARDVTAGVRWMSDHGAERLILTNAAGTLRPEFVPGTWMMLSDHLNLTGISPLGGPRFIDLSAAYDPEWRTLFRDISQREGITLHEGVYAGLRGPQYETPAEIRMLRTLGADAVGMSTVLETIEARSLGIPVAAFSCLTNWAAGISTSPLDHHEVIETGRQAASTMIQLLAATLPVSY
jgi:purine-nucleoside phosphorylase